MKKAYLIILFLVINFGGLALGNWFMGDAVSGEWYTNLNKAPWTPPGWVFGAAWTLIMLCFCVFSLAFILNVSWNYLFFNQHLVNWALINISFLTLVIFYFFISYRHDKLSKMRYLLLPYLIWLCIATSLNAYIAFYN